MPIKLVNRHGSTNWYLRGTVRGITVDETTGTDDRKRAEEIRIKREAEILERSIHGYRKTATFLEASVLYLEAGGQPRFVGQVARHFGTAPLESVDQLAIDRAAQLLYPKASGATRNRQVYTPVSAILNFAAKRGLCNRPVIERPKQPKSRVRWLTQQEAQSLIDACSPHLKSLVIFLLYTGARLSEALYLDWREVDFERGQVVFLDTKTGVDRGVPFHPYVRETLEALPYRVGAVFRRPDGFPYEEKINSGGQIKTAFKGACRRAGIVDFNPHDCRHTWATWHYAANRDLIALKQLGGWSSERMVLRYAHMNVSNHSASISALPWGKSGDLEQGLKKPSRKTAC